MPLALETFLLLILVSLPQNVPSLLPFSKSNTLDVNGMKQSYLGAERGLNFRCIGFDASRNSLDTLGKDSDQ